MHKHIQGFSYNPEAHLAAFNYQSMAVILEAKRITIYNSESESEVKTIIEWIKKEITIK